MNLRYRRDLLNMPTFMCFLWVPTGAKHDAEAAATAKLIAELDNPAPAYVVNMTSLSSCRTTQ